MHKGFSFVLQNMKIAKLKINYDAGYFYIKKEETN
jgi:hypothetical protein